MIPGLVKFTVEIRDLSSEKIEKIYQKATQIARRIEHTDGVHLNFDQVYNTVPALADQTLQKIVLNSANSRGYKTDSLPSGAGHDAQEMAKLGPMAMIFIPSVKGISHSPEEFSGPDDITRGANMDRNEINCAFI